MIKVKPAYFDRVLAALSFPDHRGIPGHQGGSLPRGEGAGNTAQWNFDEQASMGVYQTKDGNVVYDPSDLLDPLNPGAHIAGADRATDTLSLDQLRQLPKDKVITIKQYYAKGGGSRRHEIKVGSLVLNEQVLE